MSFVSMQSFIENVVEALTNLGILVGGVSLLLFLAGGWLTSFAPEADTSETKISESSETENKPELLCPGAAQLSGGARQEVRLFSHSRN